MWLLERAGLRVVMLLSCWMLAIGCVMRSFVPYDQPPWMNVIFHVAQAIIGNCGLIIFVFAPRISALWFPVSQRIFATAVGLMSNPLGQTLAFLITPFLTRKYDIHTLLYVEAETGVFVALLASIYFPPRPATPPSTSAGLERVRLLPSLKSLACNPAFIILNISGGLLNGAIMYVKTSLLL